MARARSARRVADCRVFSVERSVAASPVDGSRTRFIEFSRVDWAQIVPITPDGKVVLVRQYRHGAQRVTLEIPGGLVDPGEDPATAALRECLEETGYRARAAVSLGVVNPNPGAVREPAARVLRRDVEPERAVQNTGTELTEVVLVPVARARGAAACRRDRPRAWSPARLWRYSARCTRRADGAIQVAARRRRPTEGARRCPPRYLIFFFGALVALGPLEHRLLLARHSGDGERLRRHRRERPEHAERVLSATRSASSSAARCPTRSAASASATRALSIYLVSVDRDRVRGRRSSRCSCCGSCKRSAAASRP